MSIISNALTLQDCDYLQLAKLSGFNDKEIEMVKIFWNAAFNKSWIYLSNEIIHDFFGYKKSDCSISDFIKKLRDLYKINIDYKEVNKDHDLIKLYKDFTKDSNPIRNVVGNRKKYYIVSGQALKKMAMRANTSKGDETCDYFIKVESLCITMKDYTMEKLKADHVIQLQLATEKNLNLIKKIYNKKIHMPDGFVYLITCNQYAKENHFRFGRTEDLFSRLTNYQVGRTKSDLLYYVFIYRTEEVILLELLIRRLLKEYRQDNEKDIYVLPWYIISTFIKKVCDAFHNGIIVEKNNLINLNLNVNYCADIDFIALSPNNRDYQQTDYVISHNLVVDTDISKICEFTTELTINKKNTSESDTESSTSREDKIKVEKKLKEKFIIEKRVKKKKETKKCRSSNAEHQANKFDFETINGIESAVCTPCKLYKLNILRNNVLDKLNVIDINELNCEDKQKMQSIKNDLQNMQTIDIFKKSRILITKNYKRCTTQFAHKTELDAWGIKANFFIRTELNIRVNDRYSSYCMACEITRRDTFHKRKNR